MPAQIDVPLSTGERLAAYKEKFGEALRNPASPDWYKRETHERAREFFWAAPYDARFPQIRKQRQCFAYFVDFHRCKELMGQDYKPCKFFQNVYKDFCPGFWVTKWNELIDEGRFPAKFDR
ncbi:unnamed protein product, partial [Mesorhabditis spiculigera]